MVEEGLTTCKPKGLPPALHIRLKLDEARARATRKVAGGWGAPAEPSGSRRALSASGSDGSIIYLVTEPLGVMSEGDVGKLIARFSAPNEIVVVRRPGQPPASTAECWSLHRLGVSRSIPLSHINAASVLT
jgi:hypothetical protein